MTIFFRAKSISRNRLFKNFFISFIFVFSFLLIFFSKSDYFLINKLRNYTNDYLYPITNFVYKPMSAVSILKNQIYDFNNLKSENILLKEEIMRLKRWQILAIQNTRENKVFKKLLNATDNNLELIKTASVIHRSDFLFAKMININAGMQHGLKDQMTAINHRGLVGRIMNPSTNNAKILLINDPNSSIAVKTISNDNFSLVQGSDDGIHLVSSFIKNDRMPMTGDLVVTSGSAQIFPSDILVGKIVKISKNKFYVLPFVDFNNIDYVQIVKSK